jgi:hypothetical protein
MMNDISFALEIWVAGGVGQVETNAILNAAIGEFREEGGAICG